MKQLWQPRGVAVVGASATPGALGYRMVRYLVEHGYTGAIYPINPRYEVIDGLACYRAVSEAPGPVDLALILLGADRVAGALEDCAAAKVGYVVVHASGFGETGDSGKALEQQLVDLCRNRGMRLVGPNCIGLVSVPDRLVAGFSPLFAKVSFEPGNIGLISQSGALGYGIVSLALEEGLRFSRVVNTGNEAELTSAELVRGLLEDESTQVVLVYTEGLKRAPDWRELGAQSQRVGKPIVMLKVGRSEAGVRAAASHTAALAGDDAVWDAAFRQLGLIRVADVDEMLDVAAVFAQPRRPAGGRVGVLTTSGGAGIMAADALGVEGLMVPELGEAVRAELEGIIPAFGSAANPVDVTAQVIHDPVLFRQALRSMAAAQELDLLLVCFCVLQGAEADRVVDDLLAVHSETGKPVLVSRTGGEGLAPGAAARLRAAGIPVYRSPVRAARAAGSLVRFARGAPAAAAAQLPPPGPAPAAPWRGHMTERAAKALLASEGFPVTEGALAATPEEAAAIAEQLGYPVVLKVDSPDLPHKTEAAGVRLDLTTPAEVRRAFTEILTSAKNHSPTAIIKGCLVQQQVSGALAELLIGITPSPMGPLLTVGAGGIFTEALRDVTRRLAPVTEAEAHDMLRELRIYPLLTGARGRPRANLGALTRLIAQLSQTTLRWPGRWEVDLNPVLALPEGARIVDALIAIHEEEDEPPC